MKFPDQRGQTTTEYLMIVGLITACAIVLLELMYPALRASLRAVAECMLGDVC